MRMTRLICEKCGQEFERKSSEVKRNQRMGRKAYCSLRCCGDIEKIPLESRDNSEHLVAANRFDEFSSFRGLFSTSKRHAREKGREFDITLNDLKSLWEKQGGICPYTGWKMDLPRTTKDRFRTNSKVSLDRKDSSKGYTSDNIQFVSYMANCAKNVFNESDLIAFCKAVANHKAEHI